MGNNSYLTIIGSLEELNTLNFNKIIVFEIDSFNYGILIYSLKNNRILFLKLILKSNIFSSRKASMINLEADEKQPFIVYLLNVFCLPFIILDVVNIKKCIWAVGPESVIDVKPYIESALEKDSFHDDDSMDTDEVEDYQHNTFEVAINVHQFEKYSFHYNDIFVRFNNTHFAVCKINNEIGMWQLKLISFNKPGLFVSGPSVNFPLSFKESLKFDDSPSTKPMIILLENGDAIYSVVKDIFRVNCLPSESMCLIGHPDGKLLWSCFDYKKLDSKPEIHILYDMAQPIVNFHVTEKSGSALLLTIGALGKVTLFSSKKQLSFTFCPDKKIYISTTYLKSSVTHSVLINDNLIYVSNDGTLWTSSIPELISNSSDHKKNNSICCEVSDVKDIIPVNKKEGLLLLLTGSGNLYLSAFQKESESTPKDLSLPFLMNECLQQSTTMQKLIYIKSLQSKLFSAISTFASIKFTGNVIKESIPFSITEINVQPKKYVLVISLQWLQALHLDFDLCYVNATVFTYFQNDYTVVSKTTPCNPNYPTLCLELTDTVLQPPFISIFPLFVEVGIILQIPDEWKKLDCFKLILSCLPIYLRIQTFMVHELHLFQCNALYLPQSFNYDESKLALNVIKQMSLKRPISNLLKIQNNEELYFPLHFNFFLTVSTVEKMMDHSKDSDPLDYIQKLLNITKVGGNYFTSRNSPLTISITKNNSMLLITVTAKSFVSLLDHRMAIMNVLLTAQNKCITNSSSYINVPASLHKKCEEMLKSVENITDHDVDSNETFQIILQSYHELRGAITEKLPIL